MKKKFFLFGIVAVIICVFSFSNIFDNVASAQVQVRDAIKGNSIQGQMQAFAGEEGAQYGEPSDIRVVVARIIKIFL